jgi:hypothetical protein
MTAPDKVTWKKTGSARFIYLAIVDLKKSY